MIRSIRAELFALLTTRGAWLTLAGIGLAELTLAPALGMQGDPAATWHGLGPMAGVLTGYPMLLLGVVAVTQDHRFRSIVPVLLITPGRRRVLAAKAAGVAAVAGPVAALAQTLWLGAGVIRHGGPAMHTDRPADLLRLYAITVGGVVLLGVTGVAFGGIARNAAAVFVAVPAGALVEALLPPLRYHGPFTSGLGTFGAHHGTGAWTLLGWAALALAAAAAFAGRDIAE